VNEVASHQDHAPVRPIRRDGLVTRAGQPLLPCSSREMKPLRWQAPTKAVEEGRVHGLLQDPALLVLSI
jgi:hypothetical protein